MDTLRNELSDLQSAFDLQEVVKRAVKYLIEGGAVAVAAYYIPKKQMNIEEIVMIAITAAATFALLDMYAPSIGNAARQGTGFGIGANMAGFPAVA
jgi:ABC-type Co2+ transport system permease subunit